MGSVAVLEATRASLRLAFFTVRKKQYICTDCREIVFDSEESWLPALTKAVAELTPELSKADSFGVCLPLENTVYRKLVMPFANGAQISQTIAYSLEEFLSGPVENYVVSYRAISGEDTHKQLIECLCCEKAIIAPLFGALTTAGLRPAIITASAISSANIFPVNGQAAVLAEVRDARAEITYFDGSHFAGGRAFQFSPQTFDTEMRRTMLSLDTPSEVSVCRTDGSSALLGITDLPHLPLPYPEGDNKSPVSAPLYGLAKILLESREDNLNLCSGEFAPPGPLQKMAPVLMISAALLFILLLVPYIKSSRDHATQRSNLNQLTNQRDEMFYSCFPAAPPKLYPDEQEGMFRNAVRKMSSGNGKNNKSARSALEAWLAFYSGLPNNKAKPKWWMTQLDARDNELSMTVRAGKYEIGLALLYAALQNGGYEASLDNLHMLDSANVTFILKAKKKEDK